jgi:hypothetical protein
MSQPLFLRRKIQLGLALGEFIFLTTLSLLLIGHDPMALQLPLTLPTLVIGKLFPDLGLSESTAQMLSAAIVLGLLTATALTSRPLNFLLFTWFLLNVLFGALLVSGASC